MNYYRRYLGDYGRDTRDLSIVEHGAYGLLLDAYYGGAKPLPADAESLYRICSAMTDQERAAVRKVADRFFPVNGDGMRHNRRADRELTVAMAALEKQRKSGSEAAEKRWSTHRSTGGSTHELTDGSTGGSAIQPPTTNHQPPIPASSLQPTTKDKGNSKERAAASPPALFTPKPGTRDWAEGKGFTVTWDAHLEYFRNYLAQGHRYKDQDAAFRNCLTADWGNLRKQAGVRTVHGALGKQAALEAGNVAAARGFGEKEIK